MKSKLYLFIVLAFLITGCVATDNLSFNKVALHRLTGNTREWVERVSQENGVHLLEDGRNLYVFFNSYNVLQGEAASYFTDVTVEAADNILIISYNKMTADNNDDKVLNNNRLVYVISTNMQFDIIRLVENEAETHFRGLNRN